ncbi:colicin V family bacteriocin [Klebsiella aerogenes]|nr:colicin V family bacteriocin [Klebsiella aerogenes]
MKELTNKQLGMVSGAGGDIGREIAQGIGAGAGTFVGGTPGAITGGIAGGQVYDWAATKTPDPAMSPSGLGGTLKQKPANLPSEAWNATAGRECYWSPNNLNDICY